VPDGSRAAWDALNPFPWYRAMRDQDGVAVDERGALHVFDYADVRRVLSDSDAFSSQFSGGQEDPHNPISASIIAQDPPRHRQLRALVSQAFTPRAVERLEPRIEVISRELLDAVAGRPVIDAVRDFSYPLPVIVIAEMLGIPASERERFKVWSDAIVSSGEQMDSDSHAHADSEGARTPEATHQHLAAEMAQYFREMIAFRRDHPGEDLISALLTAEVDGKHLTELELLGFCVLLLVAGNETTTNLITNTLLICLDQPESMRTLWNDPDLLPKAIEESLRFRSPVQSMYRVAKAATRVKDHDVQPGQPVVAWIGSANHDPERFASPEDLDWERGNRDHIAFGHGIHTCLGAPLARLESRIALGQWIRRVDQMSLVPGTQLEPVSSSVVYGVHHLPLEVSWRA
jgi:cytochrome P450